MARRKTAKKKTPAKRVRKVAPTKVHPKTKAKKKTKLKVRKKDNCGVHSSNSEPQLSGLERKLKALEPYHFKPGQSGNPSGRPKDTLSMTATLRKMLTKKCPVGWRKGLGLGKDATIKDGIMAAATKAAAKGDHKFFNTILERMDGKVPDIVHSTTTTLENFSDEELGAIIQNGHGDGDEGDGGDEDEGRSGTGKDEGDGVGAVQAPGDGDGGDAEDGGSP